MSINPSHSHWDDQAPILYRCDTQTLSNRVIWRFFSIIIFPIVLYELFHRIIGTLVIVASKTPKAECTELRKKITPGKKFQYTRVIIETNGLKIDTVVIKNQKTPFKNRWVVFSGGSGTPYEKFLSDNKFEPLLEELNANGITFNYPGVGRSSGYATRPGMLDALNGVVNWVKEHKGVFIIIGFSIGGGIVSDLPYQEEALRILDRTFADFSNTVATSTNSKLLKIVAIISGWNIRPIASLTNQSPRAIILQSAKDLNHEEISDKSSIVHDTEIHEDDSLAAHFLALKAETQSPHLAIGIKDDHSFGWTEPAGLSRLIKKTINWQ